MEDFIKPLSPDFDNIYFIEGLNSARYPYSNSMLFGHYLIDTGISHKRLRMLKRHFQIKNVLLSHWHEDHTFGNAYFKDKATFYCHEKDKAVIEDIEKMAPYYNVDGTSVAEEITSLIEVLRMKNVTVEEFFEENQVFHIDGGIDLKVLHTPGHTAGHCSFYELNSKIAFFGDVDLTRYPFYGNIDASLIEFEKSIDRLKKLDIEIAITGHKAPIYGKTEIENEIKNYESILQGREERILSSLNESNPIRPSDLEGQNLIYRKYTIFKNFELISEVLMIEKHFEKLEENSLIIRNDDGFILN